jgi:FixJ family two-component response regulator
MTIKISDVFPSMTPRQREVCALLIMGYTSKRVGHVLGVSPRTVEDHRQAIMKAAQAVSLSEIAIKLCGSPEIVA